MSVVLIYLPLLSVAGHLATACGTYAHCSKVGIHATVSKDWVDLRQAYVDPERIDYPICQP